MGSTIRADLAPITGLADDLAGGLLTEMLGHISDTVKTDVLEVGKKATGGDLRLSRYGKGRSGGTRMTVVVNVSAKRSTIDLEPPGMWALATGGAKPHYVGPGSRTRGGKPRKRHPGSRGNGSLDTVWDDIADIVVDTIDDTLDKAVN